MKGSTYSNFDNYSIDLFNIKNHRFLSQKEHFGELGLAFLYGRAGLPRSLSKALFFLTLSSEFGDLDSKIELCKVNLFQGNWDMARICFLRIKSKHPFYSLFGFKLTQVLQKQFVDQSEFMHLLFLTRMAVLNKSNLAVVYYTLLYTRMKGKWVGGVLPGVNDYLDRCVKAGDPACAYLLGKLPNPRSPPFVEFGQALQL